MTNAYRWAGDTLILKLRVVPRSKQDEISGFHDNALKVRVTAPPVQGKANARLLSFLAAEFGVSKRAVTLLSGRSAGRKRVAIAAPQRLPHGIRRPGG